MNDYGQEQQPFSEHLGGNGILIFDDVPSVDSSYESDDYIESKVVPLGSLGFVKVSAEKPKHQNVDSYFNPEDDADTVNEKGQLIRRSARDLARKGFFTLHPYLATSHSENVMRKMRMKVWIDNGNLLLNAELRKITRPEEDEGQLETFFPELSDLPTSKDMEVYYAPSVSFDPGKDVYTMLPKDMFPRIRLSVEQLKEGGETT